MEAFPVLDVHTNNAVYVWPSIKLAIETADFIALDLELSGLGDRKKLSSKCLEERYRGIGDAANTRSIISVGLSLFKSSAQPQDTAGNHNGYCVQTYNLLALCSQPYIVEPEALKFLRRHGFDFNKQYTVGLPYIKGSLNSKAGEDVSLNKLFDLLSAAKRPLVLHNGLVDLVFLYSNLYLPLPTKLSTFLADIEDLFPLGVYDTKYIAEYHIRLKASYLQYVFRACLEWNGKEREKVEVQSVQPPLSDDVYHVTIESPSTCTSTQPVCQQYAAHGWCSKADDCTESHNVSHIVNSEKLKGAILKNRKRRLKEKERKKRLKLENLNNSGNQSVSESSYDGIANPFSQVNPDIAECKEHVSSVVADKPGGNRPKLNPIENSHRAGVDAFMTGLSYSMFKSQLSKKGINVKDMCNKIYLSGKNLPLQVTRGNFGKPSNAHMARVKLYELVG